MERLNFTRSELKEQCKAYYSERFAKHNSERFGKNTLRDVVGWYTMNQGVRDFLFDVHNVKKSTTKFYNTKLSLKVKGTKVFYIGESTPEFRADWKKNKEEMKRNGWNVFLTYRSYPVHHANLLGGSSMEFVKSKEPEWAISKDILQEPTKNTEVLKVNKYFIQPNTEPKKTVKNYLDIRETITAEKDEALLIKKLVAEWMDTDLIDKISLKEYLNNNGIETK